MGVHVQVYLGWVSAGGMFKDLTRSTYKRLGEKRGMYVLEYCKAE